MKSKVYIALLMCIMALCAYSCKKDTDPNTASFKIVKETEKIVVGTTEATISGTYEYPGTINSIKVRVGTSEQLFGSNVYVTEVSGKAYSVNITGLCSGTKYYYRYEVNYGAKDDYLTETDSFTTQSESPTVKTLEVQAIDSTTFRVKCVVDADGGSEVTERGICFNTYGDPTLDDETMQHASGGMGQYTLRIEGLALSTKYYVCAYAKNASGIGFGEVLEFETLAEARLPEVSTVEVSNVTSTTATCMGNVASDGGLELTDRGVCWSLSANPTTIGSHAAATDATLGVFEVAMTGLTPNKTYHVRAYATNAKGTAYGDDLTFTTTEGLPVVTTSGITEITATSAKGEGEVTDQGASNVTERGICWGTSHNPTISGTHASSGTGAGSYTVSMTNLTPNATYYVRAYATNSQGTAYGAEVSFTALEGLPVVVTLDVTDITATSAKAHGKVTDQGGSTVTERGICWGTEPSPTVSGSHANSGTGAGEYTVDLTGLVPGTHYYVRAYAINAQGMTYGGQEEFTTEATVPTVTTGSISGTTVNGEVTSEGGATVTERGVCWSTSHTPTVDGSHASGGSGLGTFSVELSDLAPGTTYYVRAYATNSAGTAYGSEKTLTTEANLPTVTTGDVSNIQQTSAQGSGNVTNDGGADVTERGVCWSTSHNPTISDNHANNGTGAGSFTVNMTGLTANTKYYVRAYATNSAGVAYGNEVNFTTSQNVSAPTVTTSQVTNVTQTTATGGGNVTSDGGASVTERGICWGTSHNPTTSNSHANSGTGTGTYTVNMTSLTANTTYYVRAYAINSAGTAYGSEVSFTTSDIPSYTIAVSANPSSGGTVSGGGTYQQGQSCTVTASANTGYTFLRWTENGSQVSTNANYTFTVSGNRTLVAQFQAQSYTIIVSANPSTGGTVSGGGGYNYGQTCTVIASANSGYEFTNWTEGGSVVSNNASYSFTVSGNRTLVANFETSVPVGAINGLFTINANGDQVYFSQGNLQYQASTNTWRFATNQYDYIGSGNSNISQTYSGWIDLFGWGTSGFNHGAVCYQPWSTSQTNSDYYAYGQYTYNLYDQTGQADWGYNAINNGGNTYNTWRTLTWQEWIYVIELRNTISGIRFAKAQVNGVNGLILVPDNWNGNYFNLSDTNQNSANYTSNVISYSIFINSIQAHGAVFLPAAGGRDGTSVYNEGARGDYWTASYYNNDSNGSRIFEFYSGFLSNTLYSPRCYGYSVRLVRPTEI